MHIRLALPIAFGRQNRPWILGTLIYEADKSRFFFCVLHHENNRLENTSIFYLPLFNAVAKKKSFLEKLLEEHSSLPRSQQPA